MQQTRYQMKEAAAIVEVENHVLRYWEDELALQIHRTEQGHRYYTEEDITTFQFIKDMKKQGYQLKAIRKILEEKRKTAGDAADSVQDDLPAPENALGRTEIDVIEGGINEEGHREFGIIARSSKEDKFVKLQRMLKQLIAEAVEEHDEHLCQDFRESVIKELDSQFRMQEENYFRHIDGLLREQNNQAGKKHKKRNG